MVSYENAQADKDTVVTIINMYPFFLEYSFGVTAEANKFHFISGGFFGKQFSTIFPSKCEKVIGAIRDLCFQGGLILGPPISTHWFFKEDG